MGSPLAFFGFLGFCSVVFALVSCISMNKALDSVVSLNWFNGSWEYYSGTSVTAYFSVRGEAFVTSGGSYDDDAQSITWGYCTVHKSEDDDTFSWCQNCKSSMWATFIFNLLGLLFGAAATFACVVRNENNSNGAKVAGAWFAFLATLSGIISVSIFGGQCKGPIQTWFDENIVSDDGAAAVTWTTGPALGLMITFIIFQFFLFLAHVNVPSDGAAAAASTTTTTSTPNPVVEMKK